MNFEFYRTTISNSVRDNLQSMFITVGEKHLNFGEDGGNECWLLETCDLVLTLNTYKTQNNSSEFFSLSVSNYFKL